ncbi:MAG: hypothetical protein CR974_02205 [Gammaproteobacteria bacterium]|nr:MAG: hypothetical protein CR974_02205 [Gammaproteobacteria bacterium]
MDNLIAFIDAHVIYAPVVIFLILFVSGFGLPFSEDVLVVLSGVLASQHVAMLVPLYLGVFFGAYAGDSATYWLGRILGVKLLQTRLLKNQIHPDKLNTVGRLFAQKAILVMLLGRFVPFGMRMLVSLTAGMTKFDYKKFVVFDALAVLLTTGLTFSLSYYFGDAIVIVLDKVKYLLLALIVSYLVWLGLKKFSVRC